MANQAWQITGPGRLQLVDLGSASIPQPGPNQALVHIQAVSLNYRDVLVGDHSPAYPVQAKKNLVPCSDGAGVVEAAGPNSKWKNGDRVFLHPNTWKHGADVRAFVINKTMGGGEVDGTLRRWILCDDDQCVAAPENYSIEEICTFYTAGVTAWNALVHGASKLKPGMTVLTQGTGGVSSFAILIAAASGATVIATSSSDEKLQRAKEMGASHLINYRKHPEWAAEVLKITGGRGVDLVVDVVGAQDIEQTIKATRYGGHISLVGNLSQDPNKPVNIMPSLLYGAKTIQGILGGGSHEMAVELANFAREHSIHPPIAQVFEFEHADRALESMTKLAAVGKVVVRV